MLPYAGGQRNRRALTSVPVPGWARRRQRLVLVVLVFVIIVLYLVRAQLREPPAPEDWTPEMEDQYAKRPAVPKYKGKPKVVINSRERSLWKSRARQVRDGFLHAYNNYEQHTTWPDDEVKPVSGTGDRNFNNWGVTVVDSLTTMILMDTKPELKRAEALIAQMDFKQRSNTHVPFFETVIRYLGGLLSAYALTNNTMYLSRADELGGKLLPVFNTKSGIPAYSVDTKSGDMQDAGDRWGRSLLAEIGSCQMEYKYLAHITGKKDYYHKPDVVTNIMEATQDNGNNGLWQLQWMTEDARQVGSHYSVAAEADSTYEYLLKGYLLSGRTEKRLLKMYLKAVQGVIKELLFLSPTRHLLILSDVEAQRFSGKFEHLACFFPGLLALGVEQLSQAELSDEDRQMHMWVAEGLAHSCWLMYADQPSGLAPELAGFDLWPEDWHKGRWLLHIEEWRRIGSPGGKPPGVGKLAPPVRSGEQADYKIRVDSYLSRPETMESMYLMWRVTGDPIWREHGWQMWEAIERKTKTKYGFTSVWGVGSYSPSFSDSQPSYFLAETIKYAYLLCLDPSEDPWANGDYIFNTEGHPLPVFQWSAMEQKLFEVQTS